MKKTLLLSALALSLAACSSPTPTPSVQSLVLAPELPALKIGQGAALTVRALDGAGGLTSAALTYTSSHPDVVSVSPQGEITARRLTPPGLAVTITASSGALSASTAVNTYGLELTVGTYHEFGNPPKVGTAAFTRFRAAPGTPDTDAQAITVTAPDGQEVFTRQLYAGVYAALEAFASPDLTHAADFSPQAGTYTARVTVAGEAYEARAQLDPARVAAFPTGASLTVSGRSYRLDGTPTDNPVLAGVLFRSDGFQRLFGFAARTSLPLEGTLPAAEAGVYGTGVYSLPVSLRNFTEPTPARFDITYTPTGPVTLN